MMEQRWEQWNLAHKPHGRMFISVGFFTDDFEATRKEDMYHTIFMLVMLLLLCFPDCKESISPISKTERLLMKNIKGTIFVTVCGMLLIWMGPTLSIAKQRTITFELVESGQTLRFKK